MKSAGRFYSLKPILWSWKRKEGTNRNRLIVQWKEDCIPSHTSDEIERNFHPEPNRRDRILCPSDSRSSQCLICFRSLFKRRRLILANLNIVLEEYLSLVIFDISHSNLSLITSCTLHFILRLHYLAYSCYHMCSDLTSEFY